MFFWGGWSGASSLPGQRAEPRRVAVCTYHHAGLYCEWDNAGGFYRGGDADGGFVVEQQHLLESDVADFGASPRTARAAANAISQ